MTEDDAPIDAPADAPVDVPTGPRHGITVPFDGIPLTEHRRWYEELERLGYTDVWSAETDGLDGFTPLALAAAWTPSLQLGVAIIPAYTRGPALLAQSVAAMAEAAPGHFTFGLGTSSDVIVSRWNGVPFTQPYDRVRDTVAFLREALAGGKVDTAYDTFEVKGFRLARPVEHPPPIFLAALRPGMLRLAGRTADGVIINWLSAGDVATVTPELGADIPVAARIFVIPSEDADMCPGHRPPHDHRLPERRRLRRVPSLAGARGRPRRHVAAVEGRGPQEGPRRRTRRGGGRSDRARVLRRSAATTWPATWPTGWTSRCWPCCPSAWTWPTPSRASPRGSGPRPAVVGSGPPRRQAARVGVPPRRQAARVGRAARLSRVRAQAWAASTPLVARCGREEPDVVVVGMELVGCEHRRQHGHVGVELHAHQAVDHRLGDELVAVDAAVDDQARTRPPRRSGRWRPAAWRAGGSRRPRAPGRGPTGRVDPEPADLARGTRPRQRSTRSPCHSDWTKAIRDAEPVTGPPVVR